MDVLGTEARVAQVARRLASFGVNTQNGKWQ